VNKDRRLGRGLAALLGTGNEGAIEGDQHQPHPGDAPHEATPVVDQSGPDADHSGHQHDGQHGIVLLNVYEIDDNPFQPRRDFGEAEIASLAESLKDHDMLQPLLVRRVGDRYQLISGERRLRAAIKAGWEMVPARLREADDRLVAELAIVENLQRKDLNPIEKALSFKRYLDEHHCTQEELAQRLKIDRSTIANLMRLLELPEPVVDAVRRGDLTAGHARALLPLGDEHLQTDYARKLGEQQWSVRETERQVQDRIRDEDSEPLQVVGSESPTKRTKSEQLSALEQELRIALGTRVDLRQTSKGRGKIIIQFNNHDEFERLRQLLTDSATHPQSEAG
jgi:ParB family chromosome partitioning protein